MSQSSFDELFQLNKDQYWWQAKKEVDKTTRAGLIPSRALQERRIIHERSQLAKETVESESKSMKRFDFQHKFHESYSESWLNWKLFETVSDNFLLFQVSWKFGLARFHCNLTKINSQHAN